MVRPVLFCFDPFLLSLEILPLLYLAIAWYLLEPTLLLLLPLLLPRTILSLEVEIASFPHHCIPHHFCLSFYLPCKLLSASCLSYPHYPLWPFPFRLRPGLLNKRLYMIRQYCWGSDRERRVVKGADAQRLQEFWENKK